MDISRPIFQLHLSWYSGVADLVRLDLTHFIKLDLASRKYVLNFNPHIFECQCNLVFTFRFTAKTVHGVQRDLEQSYYVASVLNQTGIIPCQVLFGLF